MLRSFQRQRLACRVKLTIHVIEQPRKAKPKYEDTVDIYIEGLGVSGFLS
jgi:hypothetical protein